ncbi:MAG: hypothetical protein OEV99_17115 [Nitrospira sp.]|nr:hypothetical protein [Nitrospira sp.]MDH4371542.1 hypothetical protein [Nitrospira sp.]MDH5347039.1 hypothetical protein [Nitrospira sp.]MDH5498935.1 hypothetical protein [Nitrospira sp.]MDH5726553.1 hypothetical protein [Nitrospira sp.]
MVTREDILLGVYLRETIGDRMGIIAVVHRVGMSLSGEWFFQLRYLGRPTGMRGRAVSEWSLNLREKDLAHFDLIGTWLSAQALLAVGPSSRKPKKVLRVQAWMRAIERPKQLRLFEDF